MDTIHLTKGYPCFSALRYVLQAAAKEDTRHALHGVNIEKGVIVATNGKRLHFAETEHLFEPGLYEIAKNTASGIVLIPYVDEVRFPKWRDIVPKHESYFTAEILAGVVMGLGKHGIAVDPQFIADAVLDFEEAEVYYGDSEQPAYIKYACYNYRAVLMPITAVIVEHEIEKATV